MSDPQDPARRQAIKYILGGALAGACPVPSSARTSVPSHGASAQEASHVSHGLYTTLGSESNTICHKVRDGAAFQLPKPSKEYDVVIIGGGASGLCTAYRLHDTNFLLLEKEPRLGGNAISEQWNGRWYSTGAAYGEGEEVAKLCVEIGMQIHRIRSVDAAIINDQLVPEFWAGGFWKSPYPESAKKNFAKFLTDMKALLPKADRDKLDSTTFAELLKPYGPELKAWFDNFGPNNWGADTENTSALIGAETVEWVGGVDPDRYTWPGGLGRISLALEAAIEKAAAGRMRKNATVIQVERQGSRRRSDRAQAPSAATRC